MSTKMKCFKKMMLFHGDDVTNRQHIVGGDEVLAQ
jgi:hypothetical protein